MSHLLHCRPGSLDIVDDGRVRTGVGVEGGGGGGDTQDAGVSSCTHNVLFFFFFPVSSHSFLKPQFELLP